MQPEIVMFKGKRLAGIHTTMSFASNTTHELWKGFMQRLREGGLATRTDLFSVQMYCDSFFNQFNPGAEFEKWAAIEIGSDGKVPEGMDMIVIEPGLYAVFIHRGAGPTAPLTFSYIFNEWFPTSGFRLDNRPHFEVMGEKYKNDDPDSEEEIWIPVR